MELEETQAAYQAARATFEQVAQRLNDCLARAARLQDFLLRGGADYLKDLLTTHHQDIDAAAQDLPGLRIDEILSACQANRREIAQVRRELQDALDHALRAANAFYNEARQALDAALLLQAAAAVYELARHGLAGARQRLNDYLEEIAELRRDIEPEVREELPGETVERIAAEVEARVAQETNLGALEQLRHQEAAAAHVLSGAYENLLAAGGKLPSTE